jgi:hypothetical protein
VPQPSRSSPAPSTIHLPSEVVTPSVRRTGHLTSTFTLLSRSMTTDIVPAAIMTNSVGVPG